MLRTLALIVLWCSAPALAAPALVTTTRGGVEITGADAAPAAPFVLEEAQALVLGEGALAVLLHEGDARQFTGPRRVTHADLGTRGDEAPSEGVDVLQELLTREVSTAPVGASRGTVERLVRPVPGSAVLAPADLRWECSGCGAVAVKVVDLLSGKVLWSGTGEGRAVYDGPRLEAGPYSVQLQGRDYAFTVVEPERRARIEAAAGMARSAAAGLEGADPAARASVEASVYLQAGLPTDALYVVDRALAQRPADPALKALRASLEARAGLAP